MTDKITPDGDYQVDDEIIVPITTSVRVVENMGLSENGSQYLLRVWSPAHKTHHIIGSSAIKGHYRPVSGINLYAT